MKILNLFAGIGGNRTLWGTQHQITAVENNEQIAEIYQKRFPQDEVIETDAYEYFLQNFEKFDFVWASPPCQSHTILVNVNIGNIYNNKERIRRLPDLRMYSLIIFLQYQFRGNYVVENVIPYYDPLIKPTTKIGRHYIWSNIIILPIKKKGKEHFGHFDPKDKYEKGSKIKKVELELLKNLTKEETMIAINNCVRPEEGKYILDYIVNQTQQKLEAWLK